MSGRALCGHHPFLQGEAGDWKPSSAFSELSDSSHSPLADVQLSVTLPGAVLTPVGKIREVQLQKRYLLWKQCSVFLEREMTGDNI